MMLSHPHRAYAPPTNAHVIMRALSTAGGGGTSICAGCGINDWLAPPLHYTSMAANAWLEAAYPGQPGYELDGLDRGAFDLRGHDGITYTSVAARDIRTDASGARTLEGRDELIAEIDGLCFARSRAVYGDPGDDRTPGQDMVSFVEANADSEELLPRRYPRYMVLARKGGKLVGALTFERLNPQALRAVSECMSGLDFHLKFDARGRAVLVSSRTTKARFAAGKCMKDATTTATEAKSDAALAPIAGLREKDLANLRWNLARVVAEVDAGAVLVEPQWVCSDRTLVMKRLMHMLAASGAGVFIEPTDAARARTYSDKYGAKGAMPLRFAYNGASAFRLVQHIPPSKVKAYAEANPLPSCPPSPAPIPVPEPIPAPPPSAPSPKKVHSARSSLKKEPSARSSPPSRAPSPQPGATAQSIPAGSPAAPSPHDDLDLGDWDEFNGVGSGEAWEVPELSDPAADPESDSDSGTETETESDSGLDGPSSPDTSFPSDRRRVRPRLDRGRSPGRRAWSALEQVKADKQLLESVKRFADRRGMDQRLRSFVDANLHNLRVEGRLGQRDVTAVLKVLDEMVLGVVHPAAPGFNPSGADSPELASLMSVLPLPGAAPGAEQHWVAVIAQDDGTIQVFGGPGERIDLGRAVLPSDGGRRDASNQLGKFLEFAWTRWDGIAARHKRPVVLTRVRARDPAPTETSCVYALGTLVHKVSNPDIAGTVSVDGAKTYAGAAMLLRELM